MVERKNKTIKNLITIAVIPLVIGLAPQVIDYLNYKKPTPYIMEYTTDLEQFNIIDYFPLEKGNSWIYEYEFIYQELNNNDVLSSDGQLEMKVLEEYDLNNSVKLFELSGNPFCFTYSDIDSVYGLIVAHNKIYYVPPAIYYDFKEIAVIDKIFDSDSKVEHEKIKKWNDYILPKITLEWEMPLYDNQYIGNTDVLFFDESFGYKKIVYSNDIKYIDIDNIKKPINIYKIYSYDNANNYEYSFVPYSGFSYLKQKKCGSGNIESKLKLIEINID